MFSNNQLTYLPCVWKTKKEKKKENLNKYFLIDTLFNLPGDFMWTCYVSP